MISSSSYQIEQDLAIQQQPDFFKLFWRPPTVSVSKKKLHRNQSLLICRMHSLVELAIFVIREMVQNKGTFLDFYLKYL